MAGRFVVAVGGLASALACGAGCPSALPEIIRGTEGGSSDDGATDPTTDTAASSSGADDSGRDDTGATDTGPAGCSDANQACIAAAPNGWAGPTFVYQSPHGESPACPSAAPEISADRDLGLSAAAASCGCECGDPLLVSCPNVQLTTHSSTTCDIPATTTELVLDTCELLPRGLSHSVATLAATGANGSCVALPSVELEDPTWAESIRACIGQPLPSDGCNLDQVCVEQPPLSPMFRVCVHRSGAQACPLEGYTDRIEAYAGIADDRECDACICGDLADGVCTPSVAFYDSEDCSESASDQLSGAGFSCSQLSGTNSVRLEATISGTCAPGAVGPTGGAEPSEPETFCCLP